MSTAWPFWRWSVATIAIRSGPVADGTPAAWRGAKTDGSTPQWMTSTRSAVRPYHSWNRRRFDSEIVTTNAARATFSPSIVRST
jgi:hypothetical protein